MPRARRHRLPPAARHVVYALVLLLVVEYLVLPQIAGARKALHLLGSVNPLGLTLGAALEVGALVAYAELTRSLLAVGERPTRFTVFRINLSTLAISHTLPGGAAAGGGLGYDLLTKSGVRGTDAGFALATQGMGSAVVLNVILWLALLVSIPFTGFDPLYATAAVVGALLLGAFAALVMLLTRGEDRAARILTTVAVKLPIVKAEAVEAVVGRIANRVRGLLADRPLLRRCVLWAAVNWMLDAASLWVFTASFGHRMNVAGLLVAYGLANILAVIPVTPSGLGVVEAVLIPGLVGFGCPRGMATLGVLSWRLVNFWLPIPVGGLAYLSLRLVPEVSVVNLLDRHSERRATITRPPADKPSDHGSADSP